MNPTLRFSTRVANYIKYRPSYPHAVIELLGRECGAKPGSTVADLGSGTGILSQLLLEEGLHVYGVEPNREMREAGERLLGPYAAFTSVDGTAEATTLAGASVDLVTAGQAFHWFDVTKTRAECLRILRAGGLAALVWNTRKLGGVPFAHAYDQLLREFSDDYARVNHQDTVSDAAIDAFFGAGRWHTATFDHAQYFDFEGLRGRLLSSSYAPEAGQPKHEPMMRRLREVFDTYAQGGRVTFAYDTEVFYGPMQGIMQGDGHAEQRPA